LNSYLFLKILQYLNQWQTVRYLNSERAFSLRFSISQRRLNFTSLVWGAKGS